MRYIYPGVLQQSALLSGTGHLVLRLPSREPNMQLITDAEVTVVAITSIIVLLSQFAYFVEIGYPIWRDRNQSLVGNHTYATLRAFLSTYRYSFAFWVICTASEIALLIGVGILKNSNQPLAYQCLLYCKVIKETSCIFFLVSFREKLRE